MSISGIITYKFQQQSKNELEKTLVELWENDFWFLPQDNTSTHRRQLEKSERDNYFLKNLKGQCFSLIFGIN